MHHKNESKKRVCISLCRLLTVEPRDLISSSLVTLHARACKSRDVSWSTYVPPRLEWVDLWVRSDTEEWDPIFPFMPLMGLKLSDSSPVVYERPARSVHGFALITAPVLTFLFTGRDGMITVNSVKIDITQ